MAQETTPKGRGWIYSVAVLAALIVLFYWMRHEFRSTAEINVAQASYQDIVSTESTNGQVVPVNDFQAYAPGPGIVEKLFVKVGEHVSPGQDLVRMNDSEDRSRLASAASTLVQSEAALKNMQAGGTQDERLAQKADIDAAQAQLTQSQAGLTALQSLQAKGAASANEVASAQDKVRQAQAHLSDLQTRRTDRYGTTDLNAQKAQVVTAREGVAAAQSALNSVDIRSPIAGTVYSIAVAQYDFVQPKDLVLMNVANLTQLRVRAYFDEPEVGSLLVGQKVAIVWDAKPNRIWHGHIVQAPTTIIDYGTRHVGECVITVDDANGDLLPNTNVTVTVTTNENRHVLSVPREALYTQGKNNYVYKIVNNHLRKTPVQVGALNLTRVQITSGLNEGDSVALGTTSDSELVDGLEVKARP